LRFLPPAVGNGNLIPAESIPFPFSDGNDLCIKIWGNDHAPFLIAIYSGYMAGFAVAPVLALPFIRERPELIDGARNLSLSIKSTKLLPKERLYNSTYLTTIRQSLSEEEGLGPMQKLHLIIMGICVAVGILLAFVSHMVNSFEKYDAVEEENKIEVTPSIKQKRTKYIIVALLSIYIFNIIGSEITFSTLLTAFVVKLLGETKELGTQMTAVYGLVGLIAAVVFIPVSKYIRGSIITLGVLIPALFATVLLAIYGSNSTIVIWFASACLGLCSGVAYACVFLWAGQYITLTVKESSILVASSTFGEMAYPAVAGPFLDTYPMILAYVVLGAMAINCVIYPCVEWLGRRARQGSVDGSRGAYIQENGHLISKDNYFN
jgi:nitrate/nitrite transporter NarK